MDFNAGNPVGRRWAEPLAASGQLHGHQWAGSHGRRQNGKIMADSAEGYTTLEGCNNAIDVIKREAADAPKT